MKKIFTLFLFIATIVYYSAAQEPQKPKMQLYKSKDHKLYINKSQGVYIWLSTSPDSNSKKVRLMSKKSAKFTNPLYFDTEGYNTIRSPHAVDTVTKRAVHPYQDVIFKIYADGYPPVTEASFIASHSKFIGNKKYFSPDLAIKLISHDRYSGVRSLLYSLNGSSYKEYGDELKAFHEGENNIKFYASDHVGNIEKIHDETFYIDSTPPVTNYEIKGMLSNKYVSPDATIKLTAKDKLSGVKAIYYKINNAPYKTYYKPIPVTLLGKRSGTLSFYAEDNLGNKETPKTIGGKNGDLQTLESKKHVVFEFYIDNEPPELKLNIEGDSSKGKYIYVSPRTKFNVTATDDKSGVKQIYYSWNSSHVDKEYKEPIHLTEEGIHYLRLKAKDYVGNVSPILINDFFCDPNPPVTKISVSGPKFLLRDTLFISSATLIRIFASDDHSGVAKIYCSVDHGSSQPYVKGINLTGNGFHTINYYSTDRVGNQNKPKTLKVFVDNLPPVIHYHFSVDPIGTKTIRNENYTIYPSNVMLYIASTDANSGSTRVVYKINGGPTLSANPIKGLSPGNYDIDVITFDELGNKSSEKIKFAIEK